MSLYSKHRPLLRSMIRARDGDACFICEKPIDFTLPAGIGQGVSIEHVIPVAAGGSNHIDNLRLSHFSPCGDGDACFICEKPIDFTLPAGIGQGVSIEHVIPVAAGGSNHIDNLRLSHFSPCNKEKGAVYNGRDFGAQESPYGIGKHHRSARSRRYGDGPPPIDDWDTPVLDCMPLFESWAAAR